MTRKNPQTKKVAIIGAGIAGCSTAYSLAAAGIKVTLFEREAHIASLASGNPVGMLYPRLSGDNTESHFALAAYQYAVRFYQRLGLDQQAFKQCGMLQLGFNPRELARINKVTATLGASLVDLATLVTKEQATDLAGVDCQYPALYFPKAAWVKPKIVCEALSEHTHIDRQILSPIHDIIQQGNQFSLSTKNQSLTFDNVVICNANDAAQFTLSAHLSTTPVRGQLTQVKATESSKQLNTIICSDGYISPAINGQHSIGATFQSDDLNPTVTHQDHLANLDKVQMISKPLYNALKEQIVGGRTAFRCIAQDRLPMVGELLDVNAMRKTPPRPSAAPSQLPWIKGLYVNIAHGSHGLINAPYAAALLASMISNESIDSMPPMLSHLNPNRFFLRALGLKKIAKTISSSNG